MRKDKSVCKVEDCSEPAYCKQFCSSHYKLMRPAERRVEYDKDNPAWVERMLDEIPLSVDVSSKETGHGG